jgi:hypothetical protein
MFDRLFMPALTFTLLIASLAAFAADLAQSPSPPVQVVRLERVVISAAREISPLAKADAAAPAAIVR